MSNEAKIPSPTQIHRWFTRSALISVVTLSVIIAAGQIGINGLVAPLTPLTAKIHAASGQAVRAQTISNLAKELAGAKRPGMLYTFRTELAAEINEFEAVHRGLMFGDANRKLSASMSANVRQHMTDPIQGLDRFARDFTDQVRRNFLGDALTVKSNLADGLSEVVHLQLSPRLGELTELLANEARSSVQRLQAALISIFAMSVLSMILLIRFIHVPLVQKTTGIIAEMAHLGAQTETRFDETTGLANRTHLLAFLTHHCQSSQVHDLRSAVLDIEIQGLERVREELGPDDSHEMVAMIARRIESLCRSGDFIAKIGDSEFVVVLTSFEDDTTLNDLTNALRTKLSLPLLVETKSFSFKAKIGIKVATGRDKVPAAILNQAATALKMSKASDNYDIQFFSNNQASKAKRREQDAQQIRDGLKTDQFVAHFQPIIDLENDATIGLEAFARWQHPKRGVLAPIHFVETVNNCDLANDLTRIVLGDVLKAIKQWQSISINVPYVSINLDVQQLEDRAFIDELRWVLDSHDMSPSRIAFEFSESAFLPEVRTEIKENIKQLAGHGFRLVLDDFGTLGLRLGTIRGTGLEHVKLDRAFVANLDSDAQQQRDTHDLVELAKTNGVKVVAAGVETPAERATLVRMKADAIQGYLICEPLGAGQIKDWLEQTSARQDLKSA